MRGRRAASAVALTAVALIAVVASTRALGSTSTTTASSSTTSSTAPPVATTTVPPERPQAGWTVASRSSRGVMVDYTSLTVGGVTFRAVRLRARSTFLRWHVGTTDPALAPRVPVDAGPSIDWPVEGPPGVVAVFNGGFKQAAHSGGSMADGMVLVPPTPGYMTLALDAQGHWAMGRWGSPNFPPAGFRPISWRQNLGPLVWNGRPTAAALGANWRAWGDTLGGVPAVARSALGVDRQGNLIYVATMTPILPGPLAIALARAGAWMGMELDINPYWPSLGAPLSPDAPLHGAGSLPVQVPGQEHIPTIYFTGWERDFFVALAEPGAWGCNWTAPGLGAGNRARPQPLHLTGACG